MNTMVDKLINDQISDESNNNTIKGWLLWFCIAIGLTGLIGLVFNLIYGTFSAFLYLDGFVSVTGIDSLDWYPGYIELFNTYKKVFSNNWLKVADVSLGVISILASCYVVYCLSKGEKYAIFFTKLYIIIVLIITTLICIFYIGVEIRYSWRLILLIMFLCGWGWTIISLLFLRFSKEIRERFPKGQRKVGGKYLLITLLMVGIPIFYLFMFKVSGGYIEYICRKASFTMCYDYKYFFDFSKKEKVVYYFIRCENKAEFNEYAKWANRASCADDLKTLLMRELSEHKEYNHLVTLSEQEKLTWNFCIDNKYDKDKLILYESITPSEICTDVTRNQLRNCALNLVTDYVVRGNIKCPIFISEGLYIHNYIFDKQEDVVYMNLVILDDFTDIDDDIKIVLHEGMEDMRATRAKLYRSLLPFRVARITEVVTLFDEKENLIDQVVIKPTDYLWQSEIESDSISLGFLSEGPLESHLRDKKRGMK